MTSLAALPSFLLHLVTALALLGLVLAAYTRMTPQDELALIRRGNAAAAVKLGGAAIGFALALGAAIRFSANLADALIWGLVALVVQLGTFLAVAWLLPGWRAALERGEMAGAVLVAAAAVAVGLLNAACMTP